MMGNQFTNPVAHKLSTNQLVINCDPDSIDDLVFILNRLLDLAKFVRSKSEVHKAQLRAIDPENRRRRIAAFQKKSHEIYSAMRSLESTMSRPEALQRLKKEYKAGHYDLQVYLAEGKRVAKQNLYSNIKADHLSGDYTISQLAGKYRKAYGTIKRIISQA